MSCFFVCFFFCSLVPVSKAFVFLALLSCAFLGSCFVFHAYWFVLSCDTLLFVIVSLFDYSQVCLVKGAMCKN